MSKPLIRFDTFEELKSCEKRVLDVTMSLKKHHDFEKVIKEIASIKVRKSNNNQSK